MTPKQCRALFSLLLLSSGLLALEASFAAAQEPYRIRGIAVGTAGETLAGVQVTLRGTDLGTLTAEDGTFELRAPVPRGQYQVRLSMLGRETVTRRVTLADATIVDLGRIPMAESAVELEELVVTGEGVPVERRALANTIETVSGEELAEASGATTVDQALQGRVTGAVISENSGQPGGGVSIRLRGTSSILGGAEPLIVIDGVIVDNSSEALVSLGANATTQGAALTNRLADLSPEDIERVEVVKGAAAAALYGSRANNGVIQIFTRRGRQGDTRITASQELSWSETPETYDLNYGEGAVFTDVLFFGADSVGAPVERFNLQDRLWQTGGGNATHVSASGGSGGTSFYLSGNYRNDEGIIRQTGYERITARASLSQLIGTTLTLGANAAIVDSKVDLVPEGEQTQGLLTTVIFTPTSWDFRFDEELGRYPFNPILGANPLTVLERWEASEDVLRFTGGLDATWRPIERLSLSYLFGLDDYRQESLYLRPAFTEGASNTGEIQNPVRMSRQMNHDITLSYELPLGESLQLTSTGGTRYSSDRSDVVRAAARNLPPGQTLVGGAIEFASQGVSEFRTFGAFLQERLAIGDRLYLTGAVNYEGSSAFGEDERWQLFPKVGAAYVISEEPFFDPFVNVLSMLRLRAAYGQTGGQPPGLYSRFENYIPTSYGGRPGLIGSITAGNPDLKPERQREFEAGFDAGLFGNRAEVELSYYNQKTDDLVLSVPQAVSLGVQQRFENIGQISNRGIEAALNTVNLNRGGFVWRSRLQYARNRNNVDRLATSADTLVSAATYLSAVIEGQPVGVFYGGIYARDEAGNIVYNAAGLPLRARDTLPDGSSVLASRIIGDPNPDYTLSFSNTLDVGEALQFGMLLDGRFGNDVANFTRRITELFGTAAVTAREATGDTVPRTFVLSPTGRAGIYEEYVEDGSFVKLREISVSYRFTQPWVNRLMGAEFLSVRLAGRNLYTWTDYSGLDPEINLFSANTVARGIDFATTPVPRTFVLSFNTAF